MMKTVKSLFALAAVALIIGQVESEHRVLGDSSDKGLPRFFNSKPGQTLVRACGNCHSNHTDWPWYSHVAPVSWWIERHVRKGREQLDFSEWDSYLPSQRRDKLESMCGLISTGRMPPRLYSYMHSDAQLSETERKAVCSLEQEDMIRAR